MQRLKKRTDEKEEEEGTGGEGKDKGEWARKRLNNVILFSSEEKASFVQIRRAHTKYRRG